MAGDGFGARPLAGRHMGRIRRVVQQHGMPAAMDRRGERTAARLHLVRWRSIRRASDSRGLFLRGQVRRG